MKKRNVLAMAGVTILAAGVLAACSSSKSGSSNTNTNFTYVYQTDPETLDYTLSSKTSTHEITSNVIDGLLENDQYGNLTLTNCVRELNGIHPMAKNMQM